MPNQLQILERMLATSQGMARMFSFEESKHPRGNSKNAGQFAKKAGGVAKTEKSKEEDSAYEPMEIFDDRDIPQGDVNETDEEPVTSWNFYDDDGNLFEQEVVVQKGTLGDEDEVEVWRWVSMQDGSPTAKGRWTLDEGKARRQGREYAAENDMPEPEEEEEDDKEEEEEDDEDSKEEEKAQLLSKVRPPKEKRDVKLLEEKLPKSSANITVEDDVDEGLADGIIGVMFDEESDVPEAYTRLVHSVGMPQGSELEVVSAGKYDPLFGDDPSLDAVGVRVSVKHPRIKQASRFFGVDTDGNRFIRNEILEIKEEFQKDGMGADIFARQVESASSEGFDYISTHAAGGPTVPGGRKRYNGYYTWPLFGYDQSISELPVAKREEVKAAFPAANSVLDIFETKEGREWWSQNGTELLNAKFDLTPGSRSMQVMAAYLRRKRAEKKSS